MAMAHMRISRGPWQLAGSAAPITRDSEEAKPWLALFSSLFLAELAASEQAGRAAEEFERCGQKEFARFYRDMEREERNHADLVRLLFDDFIAPPRLALDIYGAQRCLAHGRVGLVERLALIHLVFEPSALAFLSHISASARLFFSDDWARTIRSSCRQILADEVAHVRQGRTLLVDQLANMGSADKELIHRSIRTHRNFISAGIRRFFQGSVPFAGAPKVLNERFTFAFDNAVHGVIDGVGHDH